LLAHNPLTSLSYFTEIFNEETIMKKLILAVSAVAALGGCVAVPVYDSGPGAYYSAPSPGVGIYVAPPALYFGNSYRRHNRHYRQERHYR
jgi:hypothetical protein